jgi:hypothetical protein
MGPPEAWFWQKREWALLANFPQYMRCPIEFSALAFARKSIDKTPNG